MPKELKLNNKTEVINVTIGEKTYQVPLATSLPYKKVKTLMGLVKKDTDEQMDSFVEFFKDYIDGEVIDSLPMSSLTELAKEWSKASEEASGESLGKSSASEV